MKTPGYRERSIAGVALMFSPLILSTAYLLMGRSLPPRADYLALSVMLVVGGSGVCILPKKRWVRLLALIIYLPTALFVIAGWSFSFACSAFGDCL